MKISFDLAKPLWCLGRWWKVVTRSLVKTIIIVVVAQ
jgi:hypothetical protein